MLTMRGVTKIYRMGDAEVRALGGVDLDVKQGEFLAVLGASGSGKTTLMNIMGCLDRPTSGSYTLLGREMGALNSGELSRVRGESIGFVFQSFNLLSRYTALENVEMPLLLRGEPPKVRREIALEALRRVGLADRAGHRPGELSGGQQQRTAIARAIAARPALLLADEPTGNLDPRSAAEIMDLLEGLVADGATLVLITHDGTVAARADRRVTLREGKLTSIGTGDRYGQTGQNQLLS